MLYYSECWKSQKQDVQKSRIAATRILEGISDYEVGDNFLQES